MAPPRATPILCQMKYASVQVSYLLFPGDYNDFSSDISKQIRLYTESDANGHVDVDGSVNKIRLRSYG